MPSFGGMQGMINGMMNGFGQMMLGMQQMQ
jgi:hypothetical protein